jgi:hypothetical protein
MVNSMGLSIAVAMVRQGGRFRTISNGAARGGWLKMI